MALTTAPVELVSLDGTVTINDSSADVDFRVESNGNQHMLFVDAGNDHVNIGTSSDFGGVLNVNGGAVFDDATTLDPDTMGNGRLGLGQIADGGGFASPGLGFGGTGGNTAAIVNASGTLFFGLGDKSNANSLKSMIVANQTSVSFNEDSLNADFRVESNNNANMLFVDGGNDRVLIGTTASRSLSGVIPNLFKEGTGYNDSAMALVGNTGTSAATAPLLLFGRSRGTSNGTSTSVASGDRLGGIFFTGADGTDIESLAAVIQAKVDGTPGSNDMPGRLEFYTTPDGSETTVERMRIHSGGVVSISEGIELGNGFAGSASNTLDDYEEGAWTPVLTAATSAPTVSLTHVSGYYIKIGNLVYIRFGMYVGSISGGSGALRISGLPFAGKTYSSYRQPAALANAQNLTSDPDGPIILYLVDGDTKLEGRLFNNTDTAVPISHFQAGSWCIANLSYDVS